ncbi:MAG TPA: hypothetical protein VIR32_01060 [Lachnospiraceae bacterium]
MSDSSLTFDCPNCGGNIVWDSKLQKMACPYCDTTFTKEEIEKIVELSKKQTKADVVEETNAKESSDRIQGQMTVHICQSCGGEIVGDENSIATQCVYCGSPTILTKNIEGILKPDVIIPFEMDKKAAKEALKNFYKKKWLLPKFFAQENHIDKITGLYVPFWLFQCRVKGDFVYNTKKVKTWSDANYRYTKTDHYTVYRSGDLYFDKVPVDGAKNIDDDYMNSIEPFSYSKLSEFHPEYMSGYFADKYDENKSESYPKAKERIINTTKATFRNSVVGYQDVNEMRAGLDFEEEKVSYAMLPVWMLTTKYKDKVYKFAMNGQTGKFVGELPIDKKKALLYGSGIFAAVMLLAQIFIFFI